MLKLKISWRQLYLFCLFSWSLFYTLTSESYMEFPYEIYLFIWDVIRVLLIAKIVIYERKKVCNIIRSFLIILFCLISKSYSDNTFLEPFFWFLAAANNVDIRSIIKTLFSAQVFAFILIIGFYFFGLIDNYQLLRDSTNQIRNSMGFNHPNTASLKALQICLMYVYLSKDNLRLKHCAIILMFSLFVYQFTYSNTSFYLTLLLISMLLFYIISNKKIKLLSNASHRVIRLLKYISLLCGCFSLYMTLNYENSSLILDIVGSDSTLFSRFNQMFIYFNTYNITLFGQPLYYHGSGNEISDAVTGMYTLDNAYINLLLGLGIIVFVMFFLLFFRIIYKCIKENNLIPLILISIYFILGISETAMIRFSFNFTLVFLFTSVWKVNLNGMKT